MKFFYRFLILIFSLNNTIKSSGQEIIVPNVELKTKEDFVKTEKNIITASHWLETTQLGKEMDKRTKINAFVLMWASNSPTVTVEINKLCADLCDRNPHLLGVFLASYCRFVIENYYSTDMVKGYAAGIRGMINCYRLGGDVKKNRFMDKAIAADVDGTLEDWVRENMK